MALRQAGHRVACVGLTGQFDPDLPPLCDTFAKAGMTRLGRWIKLLHRWNVRDAVMVGGVRKVSMYQPFLWLRYVPDWRMTHLWYVRLRHDRRTDAILGGVADVLESEDIHLMDSTRYITQAMADAGVMTRTRPTTSQLADIAFGLPIVHRMGDLDIGQSIAVKDREVIAVEAIEGTDVMIRRAGELCRAGRWTLIKIAKPRQDLRFDVPTTGLKTIENLKKAGATCLAVETGKVILLDKSEFLAAADAAGIAVIGVEAQPGPTHPPVIV